MTVWKSRSEAKGESAAARAQTWVFETPGRSLALAVLLLLTLVRIMDSRAIATIRLRGFDLEQQLAPRIYHPSPVRIVAIDDKSLKQFGQWPWPRAQLARLVDKIASGHPAALGVDIIFAEPDRFSPPAIAKLPGIPAPVSRELASLPSSGTVLADAFDKVPTVLGVAFSFETARVNGGPVPTVRQSGADPRPFLFSYGGMVRSLPELTAAAKAQGLLAGEPDRDGIMRRVPLFVLGDGKLVASLTLEMLRVARGGPIAIVTANEGARGAKVGSLFIPTDWRARAFPYFTTSLNARYVSAADLMNESYDPARLRDGLVLLGVTGLGLVDQKQTPLGLMPGVEVTAQLIESMISGNVLRRPSYMDEVEIALMVAGGFFVIFALPFRHPRVAGVILAAIVAALVGFEFAGFNLAHLLFDGVYPAAGISIVFAMMLGVNLRAAEAARRRLATALQNERESKALLEGELNVARALQNALLPPRFSGIPGRREVDICAVIEPARAVSGDMYDCVMLDSRRLCFTIADVSGQGVPAALFMAMSKEVLRAAALSHGEALDQVFAEANARISAVSSDLTGIGANMMFITVFAGVLDVATGRLAYINAGHEAPFVLRQGSAPARLGGRGGPPLGSVEGFCYGVEQRRLAAGETLFLYTDGVTEAEDSSHSFYGQARLERVLANAAANSAGTLVDLVREDVHRFVNGSGQGDDITLLALRWLGGR